jgi:hypothetical protein
LPDFFHSGFTLYQNELSKTWHSETVLASLYANCANASKKDFTVFSEAEEYPTASRQSEIASGSFLPCALLLLKQSGKVILIIYEIKYKLVLICCPEKFVLSDHFILKTGRIINFSFFNPAIVCLNNQFNYECKNLLHFFKSVLLNKIT